MIETLLKGKKISQDQYDLYLLFEANELGRKCMNRLMQETYMDEPNEKEFKGVGFAFYDGRRSLLRDIQRSIIFVQDQLKENLSP